MPAVSEEALEPGINDAADVEALGPTAPQRITFEPDSRRGRNYSEATTPRRSVSRDSISSVRSRTRSVSGVPIEFRSLSFQVGDAQVIDEKKHHGKTDKDGNDEDKDYFKNLDFHLLNGSQICKQLDVNPSKGLDASEADRKSVV